MIDRQIPILKGQSPFIYLYEIHDGPIKLLDHCVVEVLVLPSG